MKRKVREKEKERKGKRRERKKGRGRGRELPRGREEKGGHRREEDRRCRVATVVTIVRYHGRREAEKDENEGKSLV